MLIDRQPAEDLPQINLMPMIDVVLCLLIFFMAATRLYDWDDQQFVVKVPEVSDAAPLTSAPGDLELQVVAPGRVALGDKTLDLPAVTSALREACQRYPDQGVQVRGEASLSYQDVADVLAACETAGVKNVRLPVRPRTDPSAR